MSNPIILRLGNTFATDTTYVGQAVYDSNQRRIGVIDGDAEPLWLMSMEKFTDSGTLKVNYLLDSGYEIGSTVEAAGRFGYTTSGVFMVRLKSTDIVFSISDTAISSDINHDVVSLNEGPLAGFRNRAVNGNFEIWSNGTSLTVSDSLEVADGWYVSLEGGTGEIGTIIREAIDPSLNWADNNRYSLVWEEATSGSDYAKKSIWTTIGWVNDLAGKEITISFYAYAETDGDVTLNIIQYFGTGGTPTADVTTSASITVTPSATAARYSATLTVPSISSATIGTNGDDALKFEVSFPLASDFLFKISGVQVEPGPNATPLERRPRKIEQILLA